MYKEKENTSFQEIIKNLKSNGLSEENKILGLEEFLNKYGIVIRDSQGNYRNTYDVLKDIVVKWDRLFNSECIVEYDSECNHDWEYFSTNFSGKHYICRKCKSFKIYSTEIT